MPGDLFYSSKEWKALRKQALLRDKYKCYYCKADISGYKQSRVDHIKPRRMYPALSLVLGNLRSCCITCDNRYNHPNSNSDKMITEPIGIDGLPDSWR